MTESTRRNTQEGRLHPNGAFDVCSIEVADVLTGFSPDRNESFKFAASTLTPKLYIWLHDHKTLGKDKEIGETEVDVCVFVEMPCYELSNVIIALEARPTCRRCFVRRGSCRIKTRRCHPAPTGV